MTLAPHRAARVIAAAALVAGVLGFGTIVGLPGGADAQTSPTPTAGPCTSVKLALSNPQPGDLLTPGDYVVQGTAVDTTAPVAPGIDRIQIFFDQPRDNGGRYIGEVDAGQGGTDQSLTASGFKVVAHIPDSSPTQDNTHVLYAYARSAVTGQEQLLSLPVQLRLPLNIGPFTPTPTPQISLALLPCGGPTPTPTFPPFPVGIANATPSADSLTLQVFNPGPGDALSSGTYVIGGLAFDTSATVGSTGVDQVQVFLDPRDGGGQFLGDAVLGTGSVGGVFGYQLLAHLPNRAGGHILSVYARSAVSGREALVSIPITIN